MLPLLLCLVTVQPFPYRMKIRSPEQRKLYAMRRMGLAIDRAVAENSSSSKGKAAKWAAAWGVLCGIQSAKVRLKTSRRSAFSELLGNSSSSILRDRPKSTSISVEDRGTVSAFGEQKL